MILYADGAARGNPGPAGAGAVLLDEEGNIVAELTRALGPATNNVAEYSALILGLEEARRLGASSIDVFMDSLLVVEQMRGRWRTKHPGLIHLRTTAGELLEQFEDWRVEWIGRKKNRRADELGRLLEAHLRPTVR